METYAQHPSARQVRKLGILAPAKTFAEIERRIASLKTTKERGDAFEIFAEGYLATQNVMSTAKVWVNAEIPASMLKNLNIPRGGAGIDGIYEDNDGECIPYQVKFRERRPNLTLDDLGGFYALSSQATTKLLFTNPPLQVIFKMGHAVTNRVRISPCIKNIIIRNNGLPLPCTRIKPRWAPGAITWQSRRQST